ncbi:MAG: glycosyltransferase [Deltaproteobacteria bacterium]|nr:glycosyltransferase [Deltaproteobacteria bacterium]
MSAIPMKGGPLRVALAHDWLTGMRGGEAVLERLCARFPDAPLYTMFHLPGSVSPLIERRSIRTSLLDRIPGARRHYRELLPLYPVAVERLDLTAYDLVVSTSHAAIKAVRIGPGAEHLCYVHTPMRYIYEQFDDYFGTGRASLPVRLAATAVRPLLRAWDLATARRPTELVANSRHVAARISRHWGRAATVIYPPVHLERFAPDPHSARGYYLVVGAHAPYKRIDLALAACGSFDRPLWIAGEGQDSARLRATAGERVRFLGRVDDAELARLYRGAAALIFPGEEDFGITPVEAQASGTPVIAFGRGGALETVRGLDDARPTGVFFEVQTAAALADAVRLFAARAARFSVENLVHNAAAFSAARFDREIGALLERVTARLGSGARA